VACADDDARRWLTEMNQALAGRNYQGEFIHSGHGPVERLRILHRVHEGHVAERMVNMLPPGREFVRHDAELQCYLPDQGMVLTETRSDRGSLFGAVPTFDADVEKNYRVEFGVRARILSRTARLVEVTPRDSYRFGYRLWIDEESKIPLRTELCDANGQILEEVLFTSLEIDGPLPDALFRTSLDTSRFAWSRQASDPPPTPGAAVPWRLSRMPPGFRLSSVGEQHMPGSDQPATHLVISDGLASVSVFIEGPPAPPRRPTNGRGQAGSAALNMKFTGGHQITAVGEVPPATLEFIASGVSAEPPAKGTLDLADAVRPRPHP
jgi:sigma-E factor negative regulatory protein RseB